MNFPRRKLCAETYWLKEGKMRFQRKKNKSFLGYTTGVGRKQINYKVVLRFVEPKSEEECIERQNRVAAVMIKNAISLAKKGVSLIDN